MPQPGPVDSLFDPEYNAHVIDIEKQIDHWRTSSFEEMAAARDLVAKGHIRQGLFRAHLTLE